MARSDVTGKLLGSAQWWKRKGFAPRAFIASLVMESMCSKLSSLQPPSGVSGGLALRLSAVLVCAGRSISLVLDYSAANLSSSCLLEM